ncbi:MAG: MarR family transcriptional regulator [Pseudomonadota bacterium]
MSEPPPYALADFLPYLLSEAAETASLKFQDYYRSKYGMLRTEWRVLFHLGQNAPLHAKDICARSGIHKTKVSRAVAALEKKRFLVRDEVENDRRLAVIRLTRRGETVFEDLYRAAERFDAELMAQFGDEERDTLRKCLLKLAQV